MKSGLRKSYAVTAYDFWARAHYALLVLGGENTGLRANSAAASKCMQEMLYPPPTTDDK